jgi:hypothetical protein
MIWRQNVTQCVCVYKKVQYTVNQVDMINGISRKTNMFQTLANYIRIWPNKGKGFWQFQEWRDSKLTAKHKNRSIAEQIFWMLDLHINEQIGVLFRRTFWWFLVAFIPNALSRDTFKDLWLAVETNDFQDCLKILWRIWLPTINHILEPPSSRVFHKIALCNLLSFWKKLNKRNTSTKTHHHD